jgi:hypothetical protein
MDGEAAAAPTISLPRYAMSPPVSIRRPFGPATQVMLIVPPSRKLSRTTPAMRQIMLTTAASTSGALAEDLMGSTCRSFTITFVGMGISRLKLLKPSGCQIIARDGRPRRERPHTGK